MADLLIREITAADATAIAVLNAELGYPVTSEVALQRIEVLRGSADQVIYVAHLEGGVVGWIHVRETHHLHVEPRAEICGLVVSCQVRSQGIGRRLKETAEEWARQRGLGNVLVRSRESRTRAHNFYLREGYKRTKTSAVFTKQLG